MMEPAGRLKHAVITPLLLVFGAATLVQVAAQRIWTNAEVHPWATALRCNPSGSTTLTSTNGIAVGGLASADNNDGGNVIYNPRPATGRQRWNIDKAPSSNVYTFTNVASKKCLDGWGQINGQQVRQYDCNSGTKLNQMVYLEYVQATPSCPSDWSTYRMRVGSASSSLCVTQLTDSRAIFSPCLSNKADASQNFFIQNGGAGPAASPPPPPPGQTPTASANFDVNQVNPFPLDGNGLAATVWPGDNNVEVLYSDLKMSSIRLWIDYYPDSGIGCDSGTPARVTQAWNNWYSDGVVSSSNLAKKYGVQVLVVIKRIPGEWMNGDKSLKTQCEGYVGAWWAAAVTRLRAVSVDVKWIELFNEPNYCGDVCLNPAQYARVANIVYYELQNRGLASVKIVGPGASALLTPDQWVGACGGCLLSGWGTHPYEYGDVYPQSNAGFRSGFKSLVNQMWSLKSNIPIYALELATAQKTFHGKFWDQYPYKTYTWSDTKPNWARIAANMVEIYSAGGSGTYIWESADPVWRSDSDLWGILGKSGNKKAGFDALKALSPPIPKGAAVLKPISLDSGLATAVFLKAPVIVVAIVNCLDNDKTATVFVKNVRVSSTTPSASVWTANGQDASIRSSISVNTNGGLFVSVKTFVDSIVVLTFNLA